MHTKIAGIPAYPCRTIPAYQGCRDTLSAPIRDARLSVPAHNTLAWPAARDAACWLGTAGPRRGPPPSPGRGRRPLPFHRPALRGARDPRQPHPGRAGALLQPPRAGARHGGHPPPLPHGRGAGVRASVCVSCALLVLLLSRVRLVCTGVSRFTFIFLFRAPRVGWQGPAHFTCEKRLTRRPAKRFGTREKTGECKDKEGISSAWQPTVLVECTELACVTRKTLRLK